MSQSLGHVTHVLLTRSRLCPGPKSGSSLHLHVLGTPPAFVLSQDQTLREELHKESSGMRRSPWRPSRGGGRRETGVLGPSLVGSDPCTHARGIEPVQSSPHALERAPAPGGPRYTRRPPGTRRGQSGTVVSERVLREELGRATASNLDTQSRSRVRSKSVHAVEFSKTVAPPREGRSLRSAPLGQADFGADSRV